MRTHPGTFFIQKLPISLSPPEVLPKRGRDPYTGSMLLLTVLLGAQIASTGDFDPGPNPLLMREPTVNESTIVFRYAGDLWSVPRAGGQAVRLTTSVGVEMSPRFSPDGKSIAFTGEYDGNADVYVIPAEGGVPKRLTAHPGADMVLGWTPDGKSILISSGITAVNMPRLYTVPVTGGVPRALPFPSGTQAAYSPDGSRIAYVPGFQWQPGWKRYRGGQAHRIWVGNLSDSKVREIPRGKEGNEQPMWIGDSIYYLSDKKGPVALHRYQVASGQVSEVIPGKGFDIKSASAGPDVIVYEKLGSLWLYNPRTGDNRRVPIDIKGDFREVRTQFKDLRPNFTGASISPSGQRVAVMARGFLFSVPASRGSARLMTEKQGVHRRSPAWSPDGKSIAYLTDERGRQELVVLDTATNKETFYGLGEPPAYYEEGVWSPDSTKFAYHDYRRKLWVLDLKSSQNTLVDQTLHHDPRYDVRPRWSPDSKWLAYQRDLPSHFTAVFLYDVDAKKSTQITNPIANARNPIWDRDGKHLYFAASTNFGASSSWLDISNFNVPNVTYTLYAVVLRRDGPNPLAPESDEERPRPAPTPAPTPAPVPSPAPATPPPATATPATPPAAPPTPPAPPRPEVKIDLDGIQSRIVALPVPAAIIGEMEAGPAGTFFFSSSSPRANMLDFNVQSTLNRWSWTDRRAAPVVPGVGSFSVSANGTHLLMPRQGGIAILPTAAPPGANPAPVDLSGLQVRIDPKVEWRAMFHEIWRNQPIRFYDAKLHGINPQEMVRRYEPFLANIVSRDELNYLFTDMIGELSIGHMWASGGDLPSGPSGVPGGLLGADYAFENGRYRLTRVYDGESWNPGLVGPLSVPGVAAKAGEYLLEIDGKELKDSMDIYEFLEGKAGRQVRVKIGPNPDGTGAREGIVVPVASEGGLRTVAWREDNLRTVERLSNGRLGYVHVPDTAFGGWVAFLRYYYAQVGKDGIIIDERFNSGGLIMDGVINEIMRPFSGVFSARFNQRDWPTPGSQIFGPKVMIANEFAGSGGDMFPWLFKHHKIGPVVGKRTWGGLVASFGFPLVDGGFVNSPDYAFYNPHNGTWDVEGYGVDPDIEVELDPAMWRQGRDTQLERAVAVAMDLLSKTKLPTYKRPAPADKTKVSN